MSSYYNNIPIDEYVNVDYANVDTINSSTIKTQNLYIDNVKTSDKIITQNLTLDNDNIESLSKASTAPYTSDDNKICSKGYIDEAINNIPPVDLSTCVKNNSAQTLTNKFILSNSNNELTANKIIINSDEINTINKVSDDATADNKTLYTKKKIDNLLSNCVKNNENQTLTNKFIMSNTSNEININKLKIKDYDNNNNTDTIEKIKTGGNNDNDTLTTKGYVDNSISSIPAPDLSTCVKNTGDQTLTNKFIMSNTSNELTANKFRMKDYDTPNTYDTVEKIKLGSNYNDTLPTLGYVEGNYVNKNDGVGKNYYVSDTLKGEIFNDYSNNQASGNYSHCEGRYCTASGNYSHCEGEYNTASGDYSHSEGLSTKALGGYSHAGGYFTQADQDFQTAIGEYNILNNTNALLSVGNGAFTNTRSDALTVYNDGEVKINSTKPGTTPKLTIGNYKSITGTTALNTSTQADDGIITTKYYVDNSISSYTPDLSNCVKNTGDQTLTNKFIMNNSNNEITASKLTLSITSTDLNDITINNFNIYFGLIYFGWSKSNKYYNSNTDIREVSVYGFAFIKIHNGLGYICVNASSVPSGLTGSETTTTSNPLYLIYVRLDNSIRLYGNSRGLYGFNPGPILCYQNYTNAYVVSVESDGTYQYTSKIFVHYGPNYNSDFNANASFTFCNAWFQYYDHKN